MAATGSLRPLAAAAMGSSAAIMAYHVASRAIRDTLFLSNFHVSTLPSMVAVGSVLSILVAFVAARGMVAAGPVRFLVNALIASALLTVGEWALALREPGMAAIAVYLHVAAISPVLVSGFWSILNEQLDPRSAKRTIGRVAGVGTLGGLAGGVLAERLTAWTGIAWTLPALALAQAWCAWSVRGIPADHGSPAGMPMVGRVPARDVGRRLLATPYLRNLALLMIGCSVSGALLDYVFKAQTSGAIQQSLGLMRVFSAFYAVTAIVTFAIQTWVSRSSLERAGLAPTIGTLPAAVVVGSVSAALVPGPWSVGLARGLEGILRGSLFRAGYEVLYTPIPAAEKRATKTLVDIGCDRLGDIIGAGITVLVLVAAPISWSAGLLGLAALIAAMTLWLVAHLRRGYVSSLEAGLRAGAVDLDALQVGELTTRTMLLRTVGSAPRSATRAPASRGGTGASAGPATSGATVSDPVLEGLRALRSGNSRLARAALLAAKPLDAALVPDAIRLLGQDDVAREAAEALQSVAASHVGQLVDILLDPSQDIATRRRIPGVLAQAPTARAVDGLVRGLADARFEVRYRCGRALARVLEREAGIELERDLIFEAVRREAMLGRHVWDSQRLLDQLEKRDEDGFVDEFLRDRAGRSLDHVFTLLSLVMPRQPLQIAFRGLHAGDRMLRGTALEYLESVLPPSLREILWPHLEPERPTHEAVHPPRDRDQVLMDLLRSNRSIELDIEALRRRHGARAHPEGG